MGHGLRGRGRWGGLMSGSPRTATARRARICTLIATRSISSQEELGAILADEGISVTQATLSRDLLAIGAHKSVAGDGRAVYEVDEAAASDTSIPQSSADSTLIRVIAELLVRAEAAGTIAVVHTPPGAAQFLAGHLDRHPDLGIIGCVAGDDTIIIAMRSETEAQQLCTSLLRMAEQRSTS